MKIRVVLVGGAVALCLTAGPMAAELTLDDVLRAHTAGVAPETLIGLIEVADGVPQIGEQEEQVLHVAGVPRNVVVALRDRGVELRGGEGAEPSPTEPDDPRLLDIVRLVQAGIQGSLIVERIRRTPGSYDLSVNDLIYLKENQVPPEVFRALLDQSAPETPREPVEPPSAPPPPAVEPPAEVQQPAVEPPDLSDEAEDIPLLTFGPMLRMTKTAAVLKRSTRGWVDLGSGSIAFRADKKAKRDMFFHDNVLKRVWLQCKRHPTGDVCFEIGLDTVHGDTYRFRDTNWKSGENEQVLALFDALEARYPELKFKRKR